MRNLSTKWVLVGVGVVAVVLAGVVSRFASGSPDGLTKVSEDHGFAGTGRTHQGLFDGYGSLTGVIGVLVVLALAGGVTYLVRRRSRDERS
ncbi:PDGLE domain-containing protein [Nocardioides mangrovi]|uniref:PDGLE domain-containing protein n=1 Tax=Nocardioides mangrovi TaxID=2874580 RepID=A0ABS7U966_9ACTN|nr:PDGLE domain-containing protein [Nocardioides mangrovi]MBZ5737415.1 PDGLE domain-containing protein [Nocardioides mangrovi]